jgi:purine-binding chemotaxis protein CheW
VRFGFARVPHDIRSRLIVVRAQGRTVGWIVDSAREFASIAPDAIKPLPEGIGGMSGRYLRGIAQHGDRLLLVVDVRELLENDGEPTETVPAQAGTSM